jgi:hypothetical protein
LPIASALAYFHSKALNPDFDLTRRYESAALAAHSRGTAGSSTAATEAATTVRLYCYLGEWAKAEDALALIDGHSRSGAFMRGWFQYQMLQRQALTTGKPIAKDALAEVM